jgi:hypothetical protein
MLVFNFISNVNYRDYRLCQQLLKKREQEITKAMEVKVEKTNSDASVTSTNPFAADMKKNG